MMLEGIEARGVRIAEARARRRRRDIAAALAGEAPAGISVEEDGAAVRIAGRGLRRLYFGDAVLRWWIAGGGR